MGQEYCLPAKNSLVEKYEKHKHALTFFNVASEKEIGNRYPNLGETLAHCIVMKRTIEGPIKRIDDVWNLKTIHPQLLSDTLLVLSDSFDSTPIITECAAPESAATTISCRRCSCPVTSLQPPPYQSNIPFLSTNAAASVPPPAPRHAPVDSAMMELFDTLGQTDLVPLWRAFLRNHRNLMTFDGVGAACYRLATWNLNKFSLAKGKHPGYREAICLTILRNQVDIVALQEVVDCTSVQLLVDEMNKPTLPMIRRWMDNHASSVDGHTKKLQTPPRWACFTSPENVGRTFQSNEYSAFVYRSDRVKVSSCRILDSGSENSFARSPFMAKFKLGSNSLMVTSVHLKASGLSDGSTNRTMTEVSALGDFIDAIKDTIASQNYYAIVGDFNLDPGNKAFDAFRSRGLFNVIESSCATMVNAVERSPTGQGDRTTSCYDNAWLCPELAAPGGAEGELRYFGLGAVISQDLRHPLILSGDGASFSGLPSDHCPVFFDLRVVGGDSSSTPSESSSD